MIWKGTQLSIKGPTVDSACQPILAMRSKELSVELRDRIVSRHRSGEGYLNISAALTVPKNTVASIILKWKKLGTTKTLPRASRPAKLDLRLGRRFTFQQDNAPEHTVKTTQEWLWDKSLNVLEWPTQSPDLNPIKHLWRALKVAVQQRSPSNPTELERSCREEWEKLPKYRCAKLVA